MSVLVSMTFLRPLGWLMAGVLLVGGVAGCTSEKDRLEAIAKTAATSRVAAATALRNEFYAKHITANAAIDMAYERVDGALVPPGSSTPAKTPSAGDIAFAGAVLDFIDQAEPDIDKKVLNDFFWYRVGSLAGNAAAAARAAGDVPTAAKLVLANPTRWQTDNYWRQYPYHDALASILLFETDHGNEALDRLRNRPDLSDDVVQVQAMIEKEMRKRPRK
jgi:hypothetical protein